MLDKGIESMTEFRYTVWLVDKDVIVPIATVYPMDVAGNNYFTKYAAEWMKRYDGEILKAVNRFQKDRGYIRKHPDQDRLLDLVLKMNIDIVRLNKTAGLDVLYLDGIFIKYPNDAKPEFLYPKLADGRNPDRHPCGTMVRRIERYLDKLVPQVKNNKIRPITPKEAPVASRLGQREEAEEAQQPGKRRKVKAQTASVSTV